MLIDLFVTLQKFAIATNLTNRKKITLINLIFPMQRNEYIVGKQIIKSCSSNFKINIQQIGFILLWLFLSIMCVCSKVKPIICHTHFWHSFTLNHSIIRTTCLWLSFFFNYSYKSIFCYVFLSASTTCLFCIILLNILKLYYQLFLIDSLIIFILIFFVLNEMHIYLTFIWNNSREYFQNEVLFLFL